MQIEVKILSASVMANVASVKMCSVSTDQAILDEIRKIRGMRRKFSLRMATNPEPVVIAIHDGEIVSVNAGKKLTFVLHIPKNKPLIYKIVKYMDEPMQFRFFSDTEKTLKQLLSEISAKTGRSEEDILFEATTFTKGNDVIEGKRNIFDLSERHKTVVVSKLEKFLREGTGG